VGLSRWRRRPSSIDGQHPLISCRAFLRVNSMAQFRTTAGQ
jgi:hypothetical protein